MLRVLRPAVLLGLVAALVPCQRVAAQAVCNGGGNCSLVVTLQLGRPEVYGLSLSTTTTPVPSVSAADFSSGRRDVTGPTLTIRANAAYRVTVQAAVPTWQYVGSAPNPGKPAADLQWSLSTSGPYVSSAASSTLWPVTGPSAPPTGGQSVSLFYRTLWQWTTSPPGTYALPINLTLTSP